MPRIGSKDVQPTPETPHQKFLLPKVTTILAFTFKKKKNVLLPKCLSLDAIVWSWPFKKSDMAFNSLLFLPPPPLSSHYNLFVEEPKPMEFSSVWVWLSARSWCPSPCPSVLCVSRRLATDREVG